MTEQLSILLIAPQIPYPPHQGTTLRNYHIIKGLARTHTVSLLCFEENPDDDFGPLVDLCEEILTVPVPHRSIFDRINTLITTRQPDLAMRLHSQLFGINMIEMLTENKYDIVQIEGLELAYLIPIIQEMSPDSKIVLDNHNAETALQQTMMETDTADPRRWVRAFYSWLQVGRLGRFERISCTSADAVTTVSKADANEIRRLMGDRTVPVTTIPNCISMAYYQREMESISSDMLFIGKMDYRPNVDAVTWFCDSIWPYIRTQYPDAQFFIVGQKPCPEVIALGKQDGITVTGRVESVLPYLLGTNVMVMPLRMGSGTRLKLLEGMACKKAIVSTKLGSEGYSVEDWNQVALADDPQLFADTVVRLLRDDALADQLRRNGAKFAQRYDWQVVIPLFEQVYEQIIGKIDIPTENS